jgi:hypothetical protein
LLHLQHCAQEIFADVFENKPINQKQGNIKNNRRPDTQKDKRKKIPLTLLGLELNRLPGVGFRKQFALVKGGQPQRTAC